MTRDYPDVLNEGGVWTDWTHYNARSLLYWYREWHERDLVLDPTDSNEITILLAGRLDDPDPGFDPGAPARKSPRWADDTITRGEINLISEWLSFHFTGGIVEDFSGDGEWRLDCMNWGRFVPSGGQTPRSFQALT